jgi:hypothetical protein
MGSNGTEAPHPMYLPTSRPAVGHARLPSRLTASFATGLTPLLRSPIPGQVSQCFVIQLPRNIADRPIQVRHLTAKWLATQGDMARSSSGGAAWPLKEKRNKTTGKQKISLREDMLLNMTKNPMDKTQQRSKRLNNDATWCVMLCGVRND